MALYTRPSSHSLNHHAQHQTSPFTPLLRFLSDYDDLNNFSRETVPFVQSKLPAFNPKFDVREIPNAYELHGELPGIEQKDIEIEFTDSQTLNIKGRVERSYSSGPTNEATSEKKDHQPTVEDAGEDETTPQDKNNTVQKKGQSGAVEKKNTKQGIDKLWVSERSVGEFSRSFNFPERVDQDAVTASFKNGVLSIVVPKIQKKEGGKKITIQ